MRFRIRDLFVLTLAVAAMLATWRLQEQRVQSLVKKNEALVRENEELMWKEKTHILRLSQYQAEARAMEALWTRSQEESQGWREKYFLIAPQGIGAERMASSPQPDAEP